MAHAPIPPILTGDDDASNSGGFTLIYATVLGDAQELVTPSAIAPGRQLVYAIVGSIHTAEVTLSIVAGGVEVFQQSILPKSGLNTVFSWEEFRQSAGPILCFASVTNVLSFKVCNRFEN